MKTAIVNVFNGPVSSCNIGTDIYEDGVLVDSILAMNVNTVVAELIEHRGIMSKDIKIIMPDKDVIYPKHLGDVEYGDFVKLQFFSNKVYRKMNYDRSARKYELVDEDDASKSVLKSGHLIVYVGFTY